MYRYLNLMVANLLQNQDQLEYLSDRQYPLYKMYKDRRPPKIYELK